MYNIINHHFEFTTTCVLHDKICNKAFRFLFLAPAINIMDGCSITNKAGLEFLLKIVLMLLLA